MLARSAAAGRPSRAKSPNRLKSSTRYSRRQYSEHSAGVTSRSSTRVGAVGSPVAGSVPTHAAASNGTSCRRRLDAAANTSDASPARPTRHTSSSRCRRATAALTAAMQPVLGDCTGQPTPIRGISDRCDMCPPVNCLSVDGREQGEWHDQPGTAVDPAMGEDLPVVGELELAADEAVGELAGLDGERTDVAGDFVALRRGRVGSPVRRKTTSNTPWPESSAGQ